MLNFYPGPSKIYPEVKQWTSEAFECGILEQNHRSDIFMELLSETIENFRIAQSIPTSYAIYFTSSATECWEIVNQSLLHAKVHFLYNGAFGKKWFKYGVTNKTDQVEEIRGTRFEINSTIDSISIDESTDCICLVQNETSNGTAISRGQMKELPSDSFKFIDATSSLGGIELPWLDGDVWLCSTQKCLGLPSGMGIMVVSKRMLEKAREINERNHYNSLVNIAENFEKFQTHYTPNILLIYLLNKVSKKYNNISDIDKSINTNAKYFYQYISQHNLLHALVSAEECRSSTVFALSSTRNIIESIHQKAQINGIILGRGYGEWAQNSFRIANFPSLLTSEFNQLKAFLGTL